MVAAWEAAMTYVIAAPEMLATAAADLATIGSSLSVAHTAAAGPTVALLPAAPDEVPASVVHLFPRHGEDHQALAAHAVAFNGPFLHP